MATSKMCLIEIAGSKFVLPIDDARKAFEALCDAQHVRYDWTHKVYRRVEADGTAFITLQMFTTTQLAQLAMEDPTT